MTSVHDTRSTRTELESNCLIELRYEPDRPGPDHETWLFEWSLSWLEREDVCEVSVEREEAVTPRYSVLVETTASCADVNPASDYRARFRELHRRGTIAETDCTVP